MMAFSGSGHRLTPGTSNEMAQEIAARLQNLLLRTLPGRPIPGLTVETFYEAALEEAAIGGDSFDVMQLGGGKVAVSVLDASGKGLAAAERVVEVRFALRAFLREHDDPPEALSRLNDFVCDCQMSSVCPGGFTTVVLAIIDCVSGRTHCLCGGAEPPVVVRANYNIELIEASGAVLGVFRDQSYVSTELTLGNGDLLLMVSDGITESRNVFNRIDGSSSRDRFLGLEGVARLALEAKRRGLAAPEIGRSVFEEARRFAGGKFLDDACMVIARREAY